MNAKEELDALLFELFDASIAVRAQNGRMAALGGLTHAQVWILGALAEADLTLADLARRIGRSPQSVHRVVATLLDEGLIVALPNARHARSPLLRITDAGHTTREPYLAGASEWVERIGKGLDRADIAAARRVLRSLTEEAKRAGDEVARRRTPDPR